MTLKRERVGRLLLYGLIWTELGLLLVTHLGLLVTSGEPKTLILFLSGNVVTWGLLFLLAYTGRRQLKWLLVYLQLVRGSLQAFFLAIWGGCVRPRVWLFRSRRRRSSVRSVFATRVPSSSVR